MGDGDRLTPNQRKAIAALLACSTVRDAAKQARLGENTVYRYLRDPTFKAELRARQDQVINAATAALSGLAGVAIKTLRGIMADDKAAVGTRARAALGVLDHVQRLTEFADLAERIAALEARL